MRRGVVTTTSSGAVATLLAVLALVSPGQHTQDALLDHGSVWVANEARGLVGLASTRIAELSTTAETDGSSLAVVQDPSHLVVHDRTGNTLDVLDVAAVETSATVPLPAGTPRVVGAGARFVVYLPDTGDVWVDDLDDAAAFDAKAAPTLSVGADAALAADDRGRYVAFSARTGRLVEGALASPSTAPATRDVPLADVGADAQVTLVADVPAVLDPSSAALWLDGREVDLTDVLDDPGTALLQAPSTDRGPLLVAHSGGLVAIDLDDRSVSVLRDDVRGLPAAPVRLDGCAYAAWSDGSALRACDDEDEASVALVLDGASADVAPLLAVNGRTVVATEPATGRSWAVQREGQVIDNWDDLVDAPHEPTTEEQQDRDLPPETADQQEPPVAVDDELGVRAGRPNVLPVLLNDHDPNGDPLVVTEVSPLPKELGTVDVVGDAQRVRLTPAAGVTGTIELDYTVSDGHGGQDVGHVVATVVPDDQNSAPVQVRPTRTSVAANGTTTRRVLDDWVDPESDPVYLAQAAGDDGDTVTFTPQGEVTFTEGGGVGDLRAVRLGVSDGALAGDGTLTVTVSGAGTVPIIAEPFALTGFTGRELLVEPLAAARGGTGPLTLNAAAPLGEDASLLVTPDYAAGTFTASATTPGTHFVEYSVTDGVLTASALVRLELAVPPAEKLPPVTTPSTAFVSLYSSQLVDVLATDHDPAGGVLSILGVDVPDDAGLVVEVVESRALRVTLRRDLDAPVTVGYTVSNGYATAAGTLTVVQVPEPERLQPPVARPDAVTVRVGSVVDVPVLSNDRHPDGRPLLLDRTLVEDVGDGGGTVFVDADRLRYLAPATPGEYTAVYRVSSTDGQWATATVSFTVRDVDAESNRAPRPAQLEARVTAGESVTIPVPLGGIDPDGDTVTLVGQATAPTIGAVTAVGPRSIEFSAPAYSAGTDTFEYTVVDALGASATGTVRVGINPASDDVAPPVAADDLVTTRPGTRLTVDVIANDSDPSGGALSVVEVEPSDPDVRATFTGSSVRLDAPTQEGGYGVLYTVANARGARASAWLFVQVDDEARRTPPVAQDVVLTAADVSGRSVVNVEVTRSVEVSEGSVEDLVLDVPGDVEGVRVDGGTLRVDVRATSRVVPYRVSLADDPAVSAGAFVWVPGSESAPPERRADAPRLTVVSGERLEIPVADHVVAVGERPVTVADPESASATHADGSAVVVDDTTLAFTSAPDYWGPASVTFVATDGVNQATITLPVTVTPAQQQPPVLGSASVSVESGAETTLDLAALTERPGDGSGDPLAYTAQAGTQGVVTAGISGSTLTLRAVDGAQVGAQAKVVVSVHDGDLEGRSGVVTVTVVRSTRPLVVAVPDAVTVRRGTSASVDVLANDAATNPFPGTALRVVSVGTGGATPPGVRVDTSADRRTVTVAAGPEAQTGSVTVPYEVADVTDDPERYVSGAVTILVEDVPDAPTGPPRVVAKDDAAGEVTLAIPAAFPNHSPITEYVVRTEDDAVVARCTAPESCVVRGLRHGQPYRFAAYAVNGVGDGRTSGLSEVVVVDVVPAPPTSLRLAPSAQDPEGRAMEVSWSPSATTGGTPVSSYEVRIAGPGIGELAFEVDAGTTARVVTDARIQAGARYSATVRARNTTHTSDPASAEATAVGPPVLGGVYTAPADSTGTRVSWEPASPNGAGSVSYQVFPAGGGDGPGTCDVGSFHANASGTQWVDPDPREGLSYVVRASNGLFCRQAISTPTPHRPVVTSAAVGLRDGADGARVITLDALAASAEVHHYEYRLVAAGTEVASWRDVGGGVQTPDAAYGRETTVLVRACARSWERSCGDEHQAGTVRPLRTVPTVRACFLDGRAPLVDAPANNGLQVTLQVRYTAVDDAGESSVLADWAVVGPGPEPPETAVQVAVEARTVVGGTAYAPTDPTTCT